jgi:hypothetical protein
MTAFADEGNPMALCNLAVLYELGLGVNADRNQAADLYALAAEKGLADAQYEIGNLHMNGFYGSRDRDEAIAWCQSAADQGHSDAIDKLSAMGVFDRQQLSPVRSVAKKKGSITAKNGNAKKSGPQKIEVTSEESRSGRCPKISNLDYEVNVEVHIPRAPIDHSRSNAQLNHSANFHDPSREIMWLAESDLDLRAVGHYGYLPYKGKKCFWVKGIDAVMVYRSMTIYVASEYKKGSCEYRQILKHEKQHVENARLNLLRFEPRVRRALVSRAIPRPSQPKQIGASKNAKVEMERLYAKLLKPVYVDMLKSLNASQSRMDSPASYARAHRKCSNW